MAVIIPTNPTTQETTAPQDRTPPTDTPAVMIKRIGGTTFQVSVHFSKTSKETMNDKISRLIRNETYSGIGKAAGQ